MELTLELDSSIWIVSVLVWHQRENGGAQNVPPSLQTLLGSVGGNEITWLAIAITYLI
jgi:hypothetical protein